MRAVARPVPQGSFTTLAMLLTGNWRRIAVHRVSAFLSRAFTAMLERGLHPGRDVRAATITNVGIHLVYGRELTRLEFDGFADADNVARSIMIWLDTKSFPETVVSAPRFIVGETL